MIISVDFDGTVVNGDNYPEIGTLSLLADEVIKQWKKDGNIIIFNSCRTGRYEGMAVDFLVEKGIPFDYFNCNHPSLVEKYKMDCRKISADVYIDDKQLGGLPDSWAEIDLMIRSHPSYGQL
jgi:hypothetical protein